MKVHIIGYSDKRMSNIPGTTKIKNGRKMNPDMRLWIVALAILMLDFLLLPVLGMLLDGMLFVFLLQSALGGWSPRKLALHAAIAVLTVGGMWSLFTFGLNVLLPTGELIPGI